MSRQPGLKNGLEESEEPVLGLFLRFFPLQYFMAHMNVLKQRWENVATSRHVIPWTKGMFLRFLGMLVTMCMHPVPNSAMYWRKPAGWPDLGTYEI